MIFKVSSSIILSMKMTIEHTTELDILCDKVLDLNDNIQSVTILNKLGRPVERATRKGNSSHLPDKESEMLFMQCVLQVSMGRDFDEQYGPVNYHLAKRANVTMFSFPIGEHVMLVTANKHVSPISLAKKIVNVASGNLKRNLKNIEDNKIPLVI